MNVPKKYELVRNYEVLASGTIEEIAIKTGFSYNYLKELRVPSKIKNIKNFEEALMLYCMTDFERKGEDDKC